MATQVCPLLDGCGLPVSLFGGKGVKPFLFGSLIESRNFVESRAGLGVARVLLLVVDLCHHVGVACGVTFFSLGDIEQFLGDNVQH